MIPQRYLHMVRSPRLVKDILWCACRAFYVYVLWCARRAVQFQTRCLVHLLRQGVCLIPGALENGHLLAFLAKGCTLVVYWHLWCVVWLIVDIPM